MPGTGTATVDFGALPGKQDTSVVVTGQTGILTTSLVEAWIVPADTADHKADEHRVEGLRLYVGDIVVDTGFTIYGHHDHGVSHTSDRNPACVQRTHFAWGRFNVGWAWA